MQKVLLGGIVALLFVAVLASNASIERPSPALLDTTEFAINQDAALLDRVSERGYFSAAAIESNRHNEAVLAETNRHREEMAVWRAVTVVAVLALVVVIVGMLLVVVTVRWRMQVPVRGLMAQADEIRVIGARPVDDFELTPRARHRIGVR